MHAATNGVLRMMRREETVIAVANFIGLPLLFHVTRHVRFDTGFYIVSRYADVLEVLRKPEVFARLPGPLSVAFARCLDAFLTC